MAIGYMASRFPQRPLRGRKRSSYSKVSYLRVACRARDKCRSPEPRGHLNHKKHRLFGDKNAQILQCKSWNSWNKGIFSLRRANAPARHVFPQRHICSCHPQGDDVEKLGWAFLDPLNGGHRTDSRAGPQAGFDFQCGCFWATEDRAPNKNVCAYTCVRPSGHQRHSGQEMLQGPIRVCCEMKPHHQKRMLSGRGNDGYFLT